MTVKNVTNLAARSRPVSRTTRATKLPFQELLQCNFILKEHDVGRTYALRLIAHLDVHGERLVITPKEPGGREELAMLAAIA